MGRGSRGVPKGIGAFADSSGEEGCCYARGIQEHQERKRPPPKGPLHCSLTTRPPSAPAAVGRPERSPGLDRSRRSRLQALGRTQGRAQEDVSEAESGEERPVASPLKQFIKRLSSRMKSQPI